MGILIFGNLPTKTLQGDEGPPPLTTNFLAALDKLIEGNGETNDTVSIGAFFHASKAFFNSDLFSNNEYKEIVQKVSKLLQKLKHHKIKFSPIYSQLVQELWPNYPKMVIGEFNPSNFVFYCFVVMSLF